jgi:PKD repeat protein
MRFMISRSLHIIFLLSSINALCQCPAVNFSLPTTACLGGNIEIQNTSDAGTYSWDYCTGDLNNTPTAKISHTITGANGRPAIEFVKDDKWYAFATGTFSNAVYRLEYANGLDKPATLTQNLGTLGGKLNQPGAVRVIKQSGNWFVFVHNTASSEILKLSFGNKLTNTPTTTVLTTGIGGINTGMAFGHDAVNGWICVVSNPSNQFTILRLGDALSSPAAPDILTTTSVPNPNSLEDVDLIQVCDQWFGFATNLGNGNIYRLSFGSNLFSQPVIDQLTNVGGVNSGRIRAMKEGENYFLAVTSLQGTFFKINMGTDLNIVNPPITTEGSFGTVLQNSFGLAVAKENSVWYISIVDQGSGKLSVVQYPNTCSVSTIDATPTQPIIQYSQAGTYKVALTVTNASGISATLAKDITISATPAPDISFTTQNICAGANVNFSSANTSGGIASYNWNFGDSNSGTGASAVHTYAAGSYTPRLDITAGNGCQNFYKSSITIYPQPVPDFDLPTGLICTNNTYTITNTTADVFSGNLTYQWLVDNAPAGTNRDLTYAFPTNGSYSIKLITTIPGCAPEIIKNASNVQQGPVIDFSYSGQCEKEDLVFTNLSIGDITGYQWNFGDTQTSTSVNVSHNYTTHGTYAVGLQASSSNGCQNTETKNVVIYSKPQPDFSLALPPFSCSGTDSQFFDETPSPTDSNLQSWLWSFDDASSGDNSSTNQDPVHMYADAGSYNVSLTATTDFNCSATVQKSVTIAQSPDATITNTPTCKDQTVQFNASKNDIQSWYWQIGNTFYFIDNPTYVFTTVGARDVYLTVTGSNNCVAFSTKQVTIPTPLLPDFSVEKNCVGQNTRFVDTTPTTADPVVEENWNFTGGATGTGSPVNYAFATMGDYNITMQAKSQAGCYYSVTKKISVVNSPTASFTATPETGVPPLQVQFTNTSTNATSYLWAFNDETNATSTNVSPSFTFQDYGDYVVDLTAYNVQGCTNTFSKIIRAALPVNDIALTALIITDNGNGTLKCIATLKNNGNLNIDAVDLLLNISGGAAIREKITNTILPGATLNHVVGYEILQSNQLYYICAEAQLEGDTNEENNSQCTPVTEQTFLFMAYPNPANDNLHVDWIAVEEGELALISITDAMGHEVFSANAPSTLGFNQTTVSLENLQIGLYALKIHVGSKSKTQKIVISR